MLKWNENPMKALDRQIDMGKAIQIVAVRMIKDIDERRNTTPELLLALSQTVVNGAELERDAIQGKIDLHGAQLIQPHWYSNVNDAGDNHQDSDS